MEKIPMANILDFSQEIIFASSDKKISNQISKAEKEGKIRKIAPRIYTTNLRDSEEYIIKRHFFDILKWRFPEAVISHRSASELRPTETGESKTFPIEYIEDKLEKIIIREGEEGINKFRDKAGEIALQLDFNNEFSKLNVLISALYPTVMK